MTDREILFNDICMLINDDDLRNRLYIMLDKYEITSRETGIALLEEDRNEYLFNAFIVGKTVKGCTKRTLHAYTYTIKFILQYIGKTVDDITTEDIRLYMAKRLYHDKVSKTSVGTEIRYLSSFFNYLFTEEMISYNPMSRIENVKEEKTKKEAFTEIELEKMRAHLMCNKDKAVFEILLSTGLLLVTFYTSFFSVFSQIKIRYSIKYSDALSVRLFYTVPSVIIYEFLLIVNHKGSHHL